MAEKILITSALPYANGPLHFGHMAGAYLPADCYARFQRLRGNDVLYICGSDEFGVATLLTAEVEGRTPQEHVDIYHNINQELFSQLQISFDFYSRTTWPGHRLTTQEFFQDLLANGYIEKKTTQQLYSEAEGRFLADRYVIGICPKCGYKEARGDECQSCGASFEATDLKDPRSKLTKSPLTLKPTTHYFLLFDRFKEKLTQWIAVKQWKPNVLNFAKHYIDELHPRAITRDSSWGIPVPLEDTEGKVFYVWFDAPIGYISATRHWAESRNTPGAWKDYWLDPQTKLVQFIGKDNIPFHAVFFPAMTMGQNQPYKLVDELPANEFYNLEGKRFSKSEGWYIDMEPFFKQFTADQIRYAIAANAPENQDSEFTWKDFQMRCNAELVGKYGNLAHRTLTFARTHCQGKVPPLAPLQQDEEVFLQRLSLLADEIAAAYEHFQLRKASGLIMELAHHGNAFFDARKPWVSAKDPQQHAQMQQTIALLLHCLKTLAIVSTPILPHGAEKLWHLLGFSKPNTRWDAVKDSIPPGQKLPEPTLLFQKIEDEVIAKEIEKLKTSCETKMSAPVKEEVPLMDLKELISIDDFKKIDLRVATIESVERVPKSKKLLKLIVDVGFEKRVIVSGIGGGIPDPSSLIGKKVMVVANLKPAILMGIESQGMLLTADTPSGLEPPLFLAALPGSSVL